MIKFIKILCTLFFILFFLNNCALSPGINKSPKSKKPNEKKQISKYSINDVGINLINIDSLSLDEINQFNKNYIYEIDNKINNFSDVYDYRYEYIFGPADSLSLNLTDTDDIDGTYLIDQYGMIDLPFIGKINLNNLTLNEAQKKLIQEIKNFIETLIFK